MTKIRSSRCARSPIRPYRPATSRKTSFTRLQKYVEVDEPEPEVPLIGAGAGASVDSDDTEVTADRMTEEELLKGLEGLAPPGGSCRKRTPNKSRFDVHFKLMPGGPAQKPGRRFFINHVEQSLDGTVKFDVIS